MGSDWGQAVVVDPRMLQRLHDEPLEQIVCEPPTLTVGAGAMVIVIVELTAAHQGPGGSSVVKVSVAWPAEISAAVGV